MSKQSEAQIEGDKFYRGVMDNAEALQALMRRKNAAMVRVAALVGELQGRGKLSAKDGERFDAIFADYGPDEEGPVQARWARMIAEARRTRVKVIEN